MGLDGGAASLDDLGVLPGLVQRLERAPQLPAVGPVRLACCRADDDDRRSELLGRDDPLHAGADEDEGSARGLDPVAVELERGAPREDDVHALVPLLRLVVVGRDSLARVASDPRVDPEGHDAEPLPNGTPGGAAELDLLDLVEVGDCIAAHRDLLRGQECRTATPTYP